MIVGPAIERKGENPRESNCRTPKFVRKTRTESTERANKSELRTQRSGVSGRRLGLRPERQWQVGRRLLRFAACAALTLTDARFMRLSGHAPNRP